VENVEVPCLVLDDELEVPAPRPGENRRSITAFTERFDR
jgi:hypothetical protein